MTRAFRMCGAVTVMVLVALVTVPGGGDPAAAAPTLNCTTNPDGTRTCVKTLDPTTGACPVDGGTTTSTFHVRIPSDATEPKGKVSFQPDPPCPGATVTVEEQDNAAPFPGETVPPGDRVFEVRITIIAPATGGGGTYTETVAVEFKRPASSSGDEGSSPAKRYDLAIDWYLAVVSVDLDMGKLPYDSYFAAVEHAKDSPQQRASEPTSVRVFTEPVDVTGDIVPDVARRSTCPSLDHSFGFSCAVPPLPPLEDASRGGEAGLVYKIDSRSRLAAVGRSHRWRIELDCKPPAETNCANNVMERNVAFKLADDSRIDLLSQRLFGLLVTDTPDPARPQRHRLASAAAPRAADGTIARAPARRAELAVLRLGRRRHGFSGTPDARGADAPGARRCAWLSSRSGRFRNMPIGPRRTCDAPLWLRAGRRPRSTFRLRRPLPPGRYVAYSRAVTREGATEQSFTARDRNRITFTVRRKR